jgi:hypothetical protein
MSLQQVYLNQIQNSRRINIGSFPLPPIERDPTINSLELDLYKKISEIDPSVKSEPVDINIKNNSVEDAIKELLAITKSKNI